MSLKAFHIFFIAISTILAFGFAWWLGRSYAADGNAIALIAAIASTLVGAGLVEYGRRFLKKLRHVSFL